MADSILANLRAARTGMAQNLADLDSLIARLEGQNGAVAKPALTRMAGRPKGRTKDPGSLAGELRKAVPEILGESTGPLHPAELLVLLCERGINPKIKYLRSWLSREKKEGRLRNDGEGYILIERQTALSSASPEDRAVV